MLLALSGVGVLLLGAGGAGLVAWNSLFPKPPYIGPTFTVRKEVLRLSIVARGSLESAKNGDVVCNVRAGQKGSTNSTVIKWLVDAGTEVAKGQKIMELDASGLIEQRKDQNIKVSTAKANMVNADENYRIQEIDNENDILQKENALKLAEIDLEKYVKGDFEQALKDVDGRIIMQASDLEDWTERSQWSNRMFRKELMSKVQADADASKRQASEITLKKLEEEKRVLINYTKRRTIQDLNSKLREAKLGLDKAKGQAKAKLAQKESDQLTNKSVYQQEVSRLNDIDDQISKCQIYAPQDGLVVYFVPEQVRGGGGTQQSMVAQGEPVREGQKMIQIPDLTQMLVNVKVPEAFVAHLHSDNPDDSSERQYAQIRVDSFSSHVLKGHVKTVDTVASQSDWFSADVKNYKTMVTIDPGQIEGLRPGMSAEVTITAEATPTPVLIIPVQSVVGSISMGAERRCFVINREGQPELRKIVVGMSNERHVEVKDGLSEGEQVVDNPASLLRDDSDMKPSRVRSSKADDGDHEAKGNGGGQKKGKGKKKFDGPGGPVGPGGPGMSPGGPKKAFGGGAPDTQMMEQFRARFESATPEQRRDMINQMPAEWREKARQGAREKGLKVAD